VVGVFLLHFVCVGVRWVVYSIHNVFGKCCVGSEFIVCDVFETFFCIKLGDGLGEIRRVVTHETAGLDGRGWWGFEGGSPGLVSFSCGAYGG
jgi:hypothetical protein